MKNNLFAAFADDDEEVQAPVKKTQAPKTGAQERPKTAKTEVKEIKKAVFNGQDGFDVVGDETRAPQQRGGRGGARGGRGGRGRGDGEGGEFRGGRGGRGGRGRGDGEGFERRPRVEGEGGEYRGRGRPRGGDRPEGEAGEFRGGRGRARGGDRPEGEASEYRGGRGGRPRGGDRPEGEAGEHRGGEYRGGRGGRPRGGERAEGDGNDRGRGRAYRPRTFAVEGEGEGENAEGTVENGERKHHDRFQGKPREQYHPMDRHSGTGRGRRDEKKGGAGRGNWGKPTDDNKVETEPKEGEEVVEGETKPVEDEEKKEEAVVEATPVEPEPEEVGQTLEDYLASRKKATQKKEARAPEASKKDNVEKAASEKQRQTQINTALRGQETHTIATGKNELSSLLQFQAPEEYVFDEEKGSRGGRGGARGGRGGRGGARGGAPRDSAPRGGHRQGKTLHMSEAAFPSL